MLQEGTVLATESEITSAEVLRQAYEQPIDPLPIFCILYP